MPLETDVMWSHGGLAFSNSLPEDSINLYEMRP